MIPKTVEEIKVWLREYFGFQGDDALIRAAQESIGVTPDGYFGIVSKASWKLIRRCKIGLHVQVLQAALITLGYSCGECGADGLFGDDSVAALKRFQKNNKMVANGIAGKAVATKLFGQMEV